MKKKDKARSGEQIKEDIYDEDLEINPSYIYNHYRYKCT